MTPSSLDGQLTDAGTTEAQYAATTRLETRRGVWGPGPEGVNPVDVLREAVVQGQPSRLLEVGCGTGQFARSVSDALPDAVYLATDRSPAMVEATRALGLRAQRVEAAHLPFADNAFDAVVAAWMLYHVPDLEAALCELRRVLRVGGRLHVTTNGDEHLADLLRDAGGEPLVTQFSSENGAEALGRHFPDVTERHIGTMASFADHAAASAYLASFDAGLAAALPWFEGARHYAGHVTVFTAR